MYSYARLVQGYQGRNPEQEPHAICIGKNIIKALAVSFSHCECKCVYLWVSVWEWVCVGKYEWDVALVIVSSCCSIRLSFVCCLHSALLNGCPSLQQQQQQQYQMKSQRKCAFHMFVYVYWYLYVQPHTYTVKYTFEFRFKLAATAQQNKPTKCWGGLAAWKLFLKVRKICKNLSFRTSVCVCVWRKREIKIEKLETLLGKLGWAGKVWRRPKMLTKGAVEIK